MVEIKVDNKWLTLELTPGAGASLDFTYSRYVHQPSYETPYSLRSTWDLIDLPT